MVEVIRFYFSIYAVSICKSLTGFGIPYLPEDTEFPIERLSENMQKYYDYIVESLGVKPFRIVFECGRYFTGPAGILLTRVINQKTTYKNFIGKYS